MDFNINKLNPTTKNLINQTIEKFKAIYSDNCRVYIRPSGTEPVMRVLVEAKDHKQVNSLSSEITNKLFLEINKINPKNKTLIDQTIDKFQAIYSDNCRVYIRPSGTEPVMRVLVEAKSYKKVHSLSSEITNKLSLEINKIIN